MRYQLKRKETGEVLLDIPFATKEAATGDIKKALADNNLTAAETIGFLVTEDGEMEEQATSKDAAPESLDSPGEQLKAEVISLKTGEIYEPVTTEELTSGKKPHKVRKDKGQARSSRHSQQVSTPAIGPKKRRKVYHLIRYIESFQSKQELDAYLSSKELPTADVRVIHGGTLHGVSCQKSWKLSQERSLTE